MAEMLYALKATICVSKYHFKLKNMSWPTIHVCGLPEKNLCFNHSKKRITIFFSPETNMNISAYEYTAQLHEKTFIVCLPEIIMAPT